MKGKDEMRSEILGLLKKTAGVAEARGYTEFVVVDLYNTTSAFARS